MLLEHGVLAGRTKLMPPWANCMGCPDKWSCRFTRESVAIVTDVRHNNLHKNLLMTILQCETGVYEDNSTDPE